MNRGSIFYALYTNIEKIEVQCTLWSVTWFDFYPNVSFFNKVVLNQSRALRSSQLFPFFYSPHIRSEMTTSKDVERKHVFGRIKAVGKISKVNSRSIFQFMTVRWFDQLIDWLIDWSGNSCKNKNASAHPCINPHPASPSSSLKLVEFYAR